jgi:hypothetical protein
MEKAVGAAAERLHDLLDDFLQVSPGGVHIGSFRVDGTPLCRGLRQGRSEPAAPEAAASHAATAAGVAFPADGATALAIWAYA